MSTLGDARRSDMEIEAPLSQKQSLVFDAQRQSFRRRPLLFMSVTCFLIGGLSTLSIAQVSTHLSSGQSPDQQVFRTSLLVRINDNKNDRVASILDHYFVLPVRPSTAWRLRSVSSDSSYAKVPRVQISHE